MTITGPEDPPAEVFFPPLAFASATTVFVLFGATASLYGPLLLSFSHRFHLSLPSAGVVLSVHFVGALCGVPVGWVGMKRFRGNTVLSGALLVMALGAAGAALSARWPLFLACVFVIGLGFGGVDFSLNSLLVRTPLAGRAHRLSLANAGYGLGAVIGPVLVVAVHPHNFPWLLGGVALAAVVLSASNRGVTAPPLHTGARRRELEALIPRRRAILATFIAAYILYVAAESCAAGWIASHLHRVGFSQSLGSLATAGFWLGLTIGRILAGPLHRRFSDRQLVLGGLGVATALGLVALADSLAPYAYPVLGLAIAAVYPMGLIWYTVLCPHDGDGVALIILFMMAGGVIGPAAESLGVSLFGIHAVPVVIALFALCDLAVFASARRFSATRRGALA
ncbi:MAG: MFS transporter [Acidobacteriota bacterium]|nr:MFS transporter [Acidobacteriota bacterium]